MIQPTGDSRRGRHLIEMVAELVAESAEEFVVFQCIYSIRSDPDKRLNYKLPLLYFFPTNMLNLYFKNR